MVVWRPFADGRSGKLIALGQCAAGKGNYASKLNELDGVKFVKKYLRTALPVDPLRFFFLPWRPLRGEWEKTLIDGGLLFDRCRIVSLLPALDEPIAGTLQSAIQSMRNRVSAAGDIAAHPPEHANG